MNRQDYTDNLLDHIEHPQFYGPLPDADVVLEGRNSGCGDVITIYLKVDGNGAAQCVQFEGHGCAISQGAASILLGMVQGKTLAQIESLDYNDLIDRLGRDVVLNRVNCATLGLSTLKNAIRRYHSGGTKMS
jgi:nitrogen fixation NifU-like protein